MLKIFLGTMIFAFSSVYARSVVDGTWSTVSAQCSSGSQIPPNLGQMIKSTLMKFQDSTLVQTMTLVPNCTVTFTSTFQVAANSLNIGPAKSVLSPSCPTGISVKDKPAFQAKLNVSLNSLQLEIDGAGLCPIYKENLILKMQKMQRYGWQH